MGCAAARCWVCAGKMSTFRLKSRAFASSCSASRVSCIAGPVKTRAGPRELPLLGLTKDALRIRHTQQSADRARLGDAWADTGLVFTTRTGRPIELRNLAARPLVHPNLG